MPQDKLLQPTMLLDYQAASIASLISDRGWSNFAGTFDRAGAVYTFVRDEIAFGYNRSDDIPASEVLSDGYGQCNTKATLLMALLRGVGVRCRLQGATIKKELQRGAVTGLWYLLAPDEIIHTWVEVELDGTWTGLEGVILDRAYLSGVKRTTKVTAGPFKGFAVATKNMAAPAIMWTGRTTEIQAEGISRRFGVFDSPDDFYATHGANLNGFQRALYSHLIRHRLNKRVAQIRSEGIVAN